MTTDSEEKILADWNNTEQRPFDNYDELYRYLKGSSKEQGMQIKKEIYKHKILPKPWTLEPGAQKEIDRITKKRHKATTDTVLNFRKRIKSLRGLFHT